jgi:glycosyltransferase involved in cell wall biosynthesis
MTRATTRGKMLVIHQLDLSRRDGIAFHVMELAQAFSRQGLEVEVLSPDRGCRDTGFALPVRYLPASRRRGFWGLAIFELALTLHLLFRRDLWRRRAILYLRRGSLLLLPELVGRLFRAPVLLEENGIATHALGKTSLGMLTRIARWMLRLKYRAATTIVAVQEGSVNYVIDREPRARPKVLLVPNGVNVEHFRPLPKDECRTRLGLPWEGGAEIVCYVGNFPSKRGLPDLLKAMPAVLRKHPGAALLLVGGGKARPGLEQLAGELGIAARTLFAGFKTYEELPYYIGAADVCVAPYTSYYGRRDRIAPLKLYAYMACGRPVVLSDVPVQMDPAEKRSAALVVPAENPGELAQGLIHLLDNPNLAEEMGARGRTIAQAHTWDLAAQRILDHLYGEGAERGDDAAL